MRTSKKPVSLVAFFALTYLFSWLIWIPLALSHLGIGPFHIPEGTSSAVRLLGVLMPAAVATLLAAVQGGRPGLREVYGRFKITNIGWKWWAAAVLVYPAVLVAAGLAYNAFGGNPPVTVVSPFSISALVVNIVFLAIASLGEEIGWRGLALPGLLQRYSPLRASLVLGLLWYAWHLPFWVVVGSMDQAAAVDLLLNFLFIVPGTIFITWFFLHTRGSLLPVLGFHLVFNIVNVSIFPVTGVPGAYAVFTVLSLLVIAAILPGMVREKEKVKASLPSA
jgi:membrane protease YdiL (CAAX protease family)